MKHLEYKRLVDDLFTIIMKDAKDDNRNFEHVMNELFRDLKEDVFDRERNAYDSLINKEL